MKRMGQIEKRKKKGRPSKADLAARLAAGVADSPEKRDIRRSLRRRNFRYNIIDYDEDYLDVDEDDEVAEVFEDEVEEREGEEEEEEEEEGDEEEEEDGRRRRRREKKVKLVVKLSSNTKSGGGRGGGGGSGGGGVRGRGRGRGRPPRVDSASRRTRADESEEEEEDNEEEEEERTVKKRRISAREDCADDENDDDEEEEVENGGNCQNEGRDSKVETKRGQSMPGAPAPINHQSRTPLPDKKQLELTLDKLQKKDTYGVYAEPVDPEELPDYHDIIKHPMDFSTVRKKLANGSYSTLEQFESDVFLISSNAMQYNAPETIYHKQARAIKELAERKFQRVRIQIERLEKESKSEATCEPKSESRLEQRDRSNLLVKKLSKKPSCRSIQEPVGSDFSSGATLATTDAHNTCSADHVTNFERHNNNDGPIEGISSLADNLIEKAEDLHSGKGILPKFGKRSFVVDENRRATYISNQPVDRSDTIFIPFEDETKQLIPVGLPGEYSYARSLARFAANLGPIAWRIASKRIEQVLPPGFKYGRGWVGEYEPLPTTVLVLKGRKEYPFVSKLHHVAHSGKNDKFPGHITPEHLSHQPSTDAKFPSIFGSGGAKPPNPAVSVTQQQNPLPTDSIGPENMMLKRTGFNCLSPNNQNNGPVFQRQKQLPRDSVCTEDMGAKRVEPSSAPVSNPTMNSVAPKQTPNSKEMDLSRMESNCAPVSTQKTDHLDPKQPPRGSETPTSRPAESAHEGKNFLRSFSSKQQDPKGVAPEGLHNGNRINNFADSNRTSVSSPGLIPMQLSGAATSFPQRQDNGLSDPVLVMKMLTEKAQRQQNGSIHAHSPSPARPSVPSPRGDGGSNAAAAAASAWMSVGAVGFRPAAQTPFGNRVQISADQFLGGKQAFYPQTMQSHGQYPVSATMHFQPEKNGLPFQAFVQQQSKVSNEPLIQNRTVVFPPLGANDAPRFQVQASWRGLSPHTQQKQKQDTLPPDLNVAFQSVDSQQPDLALQL